MPLSSDLDRELSLALKSPSYWSVFTRTLRGILEPLGCYLSIPPYQPDNQDWEIAFGALDLGYDVVNMFWRIFYRINKSHDGEGERPTHAVVRYSIYTHEGAFVPSILALTSSSS